MIKWRKIMFRPEKLSRFFWGFQIFVTLSILLLLLSQWQKTTFNQLVSYLCLFFVPYIICKAVENYWIKRWLEDFI